MRAAGYEPSEDYPGGKAKPWLVRCTSCRDERRRYLHLILQGSRCAVCIGKAALSHDAATEVMRQAGFEPLEQYKSADKPWLTRCLTCQDERPRRLRAIQQGSGCRACAGLDPITREAATAVFLAAGFEPVENFSGANAPWRARCMTCGTVKNRYYGHIKNGGGCGDCKGNAKYSEDQARAFMMEVGLKPLDPYVGSNEPWRCHCEVCGEEVSPALLTIRQGGGCRRCARQKSRVNADDAAALVRTSGFEPLVPYPGSDQPWATRCLACDAVRDRIYSQIKAGVGCGPCSKIGRLDPDAAAALMLSRGYRPLEPYKDTLTKWACECLRCGRTVHPRYGQINAGFGGCAKCAGNARIDDEEAVTFMRERGWEPQTAYPGQGKPWPSRCTTCGRHRKPSLATVKKGNGCGACWAESRRKDADEAAALMLANGLEPLVPYPGSNREWLCRCLSCGSKVEPMYQFVRRGQSGCVPCRWSLDRTGRSAGLYVMVHPVLGAVKVGIGVVVGDRFPRVAQHERNGWVRESVWVGLRDWRVVQGVEREVLRSWRSAGIEEGARPGDMPQGGWTETAPVSRVNLDELVGLVTVLIGDVADEVAARDEAAEAFADALADSARSVA